MNIITTTGTHPAVVMALQERDRWYSGANDKAFATCTQLLKPPWMVQLEKAHKDELYIEADDAVWMLFGSAVHEILRQLLADQNVLTEERFTVDVYIDNEPVPISMGTDLIAPARLWAKVTRKIDALTRDTLHQPQRIWSPEHDHHLDESYVVSDFKVTSTYTRDNERWNNEVTAQLNMHAYAVTLAGFPVRVAENIIFYRDFFPSKSGQNGYPRARIVTVSRPLWGTEQQLRFITDRATALYNVLERGQTPEPCSPEERWQVPDKWRVKKRGGKRAIRGGVCTSHEQAEALIAEQDNPANYHWEHTPGEWTRCEKGYCRVSQWCSLYQEYSAEKQAQQEDAA